MAQIKQLDKRTDITYIYESVARWDKVKKCSVAKRTLIGKIDKETGEIIPTDGRNRKSKNIPHFSQGRSFYGATYLLDKIAEKIGLANDLKLCFPENHLQILSIVYFLILEDSSALSHFEKWHRLHNHPCNHDIPSQRSSEIFSSITGEKRNHFFSLHANRSIDKEYWLYDTTSISSYSQTLKQVKRGYNKEHDPFNQFNLALVFGEKSQLPLYYRKLAGNIPDVKTVKHLLADLQNLGFATPKLVMDKGFFSQDNLANLFKEHVKFLQAVRLSNNFVKNELDKIYDDFRTFENFNIENNLYAQTVKTDYEYKYKRPYKGDEVKEKRRLYIHFYYNTERAAEETTNFDRRLLELQNELLEDKRVASHENLYAKYFEITQTTKRGVSVKAKKEAIKKAKRYFGFFALISNEKMETIGALNLYRNKDLVEKSFGNLKERLNSRRALVSSETSLDGKLFIQFIALILLSYIKRQADEKQLFKDYTLQGLLDELDMIECFKYDKKKLQVGEILEKQKKLYQDMDIEPPTSL